MKRTIFGIFFVAIIGIFYASLQGATLTVCASGCTYNNTQFQNAIDASVAGDTILLQENTTYTGSFQLKVKACGANNDTCYVTVKTGVNSTGGLLPSSDFPAADIRITPSYESKLAKLKVASNNVGTIETPANTAVKYWKFQHVQFSPNTWGGDTLIRLGFANGTEQTSRAVTPANFIFDQVIIKGDPVFGQFRGISVHAENVTIKNSYIYEIKSLFEGQCVWLDNTVGPFYFVNNYAEGGTECFFTGGNGGSVKTATVLAAPAPTTTSATLSLRTDLTVGHGVTFNVGGVEKYTEIVSCGTSTPGATCTSDSVTFSPALSAAPDVPGDVNWSYVTKGITVQKNHFTRPLSWQTTNIVSTPTGVSATAGTGGTLAAGTYYYKVVARTLTNRGVYARSTASAEVSATTGASGSVTINWAAVPNANEYYIYGRNSGGQNIRFSVTAPTVTFTDTGGAGTSENVPTTTGNKWFVKNTFELKQGEDVLVEGNIIENSWVDGQAGPIVLFTGSAQISANDSARIRNVTFRHNIVRNGAQAFQFTGRDALIAPTGRNGNFNIYNNLIYDIGGVYGVNNAVNVTIGGMPDQAPTRNVYDLTFNHNTFHSPSNSQNSMMMIDDWDGASANTIPNFIVTNNIFYKGTYGVASIGSGGMVQGRITAVQGTGSLWDKNIIADASCGIYPTGTACPTVTSLETDTFTNVTSRDFSVKSTSPYYNAGTDGKSYGADITLITPLTNIALSGNNSSGGSIPPVTITTATLANGSVASAYTADIMISGGTSPYSWGVTGTLPNGLSSTIISNLLRISGQPLVAGTSNFTVNVTGADGSSDSQSYSVTIEGVTPALEPRPEKVDWNEGAFFRRATEPTVDDDQVKVGDIWYDLTAGLLKYAQETSPALIWKPVVNSTTIIVYAGGGNTIQPSAAINELIGVNRSTFKLDSTYYSSCAINVGIGDGSSVVGNTMRLDFWNGSSWESAICSAPITANNTYNEGSFSALPAGAIGLGTKFRLVTTNGDGVDQISVNHASVMFR